MLSIKIHEAIQSLSIDILDKELNVDSIVVKIKKNQQ